MAIWTIICTFVTEMDKKRIVVVDDERDLCEILCYNLRAAGYEAKAACAAEEALQDDLSATDLLLLDVMMPGMSGFELAQRLRNNGPTAHLPIIFLTARDSEDDMLHGFGLGADDYVKKPFSVREVMARVKAVLSRTEGEGDIRTPALAFQGLSIDSVRKTVTVDGETALLTKTEHELLCLLLTHRDEVLSRQQMIDSVWPKDVIVTDRAVDVNIARLRKKIGRYGQLIVARQGFGYCFRSEE